MGHEYSLSDIAALNGNGNEAWMNNPFIYLVWLALLGNGGLFGGNRYGANDAAVQGALTRSDLFEGFNTQDINAQLRGLTNGLSDGFYATRMGINDVGYAMKDCCLTTGKAA